MHAALAEGFEALALSPPIAGQATQIQDPSRVTATNFLDKTLDGCLDIPFNSTVLVAHGNVVGRTVAYPSLANRAVLGFVLFNTEMGTKWMDVVDPVLDDHFYYRTRTTNFRYIDGASAEESSATVASSSSAPSTLVSQNSSFLFPVFNVSASASEGSIAADYPSPPPFPSRINRTLTADNIIVGQASPSGTPPRPTRLLQQSAANDAQFCRASASGRDEAAAEWSSRETTKLGPLNYFDGKYEVAGWGEVEAELLARAFDPFAFPGVERDDSGQLVLQEEYFSPLITTLTSFLKSITATLQTSPQPDEYSSTTFTSNKQAAYLEAKQSESIVDDDRKYCTNTPPVPL
eukprot:GHVT01089678.1.p1 GENE.GHVT01089678.1~~GHVT01089678.1.p1  ORF type:complete len:348 (-),score=51.22 GHVT01089678.1:502-1545(-)